jgi:RNA polymerase sigma-70 factor (ECF subfamily)
VLRHRSRERERIAAESTSIVFDDDSAKDDSTESMAELARRLIRNLPEREREAMHLRDCEGLEFDEIAAITHQSEAAVRVAVSRARQKVKQQLLNIINNGQ